MQINIGDELLVLREEDSTLWVATVDNFPGDMTVISLDGLDTDEFFWIENPGGDVPEDDPEVYVGWQFVNSRGHFTLLDKL